MGGGIGYQLLAEKRARKVGVGIQRLQGDGGYSRIKAQHSGLGEDGGYSQIKAQQSD